MSSTPQPISRASVSAAHNLIADSIHETPVLTSRYLNKLASTPLAPSSPHVPMNLFFKAEAFQRGGAFKIRGATHALRRLAAAGELDAARGVCTHSSGNHAQALALAAREAGVPAHVVMPGISAAGKIAATQGYGANVVFSGSTEAERLEVLAQVVQRTGAAVVPPFDHPDILLGQGTMGLELERQVAHMVAREPRLSVHTEPHAEAGAGKAGRGEPPQAGRLDAVVAPLGGGGMLSGNAVFFGPTATRVFGAEPNFQGADDGRRGLAETPPRRIPVVKTLTIADGLRTPVGEIPWSVISDPALVQGVYAVSEDQIKKAMRLLLERLKVVVEPSSAVPVAVVLFNEEFRAMVAREAGPQGWDVGIVLSGGNTTLDAVIGLFKDGEEETESEQRAEGVLGINGERVAENVPG